MKIMHVLVIIAIVMAALAVCLPRIGTVEEKLDELRKPALSLERALVSR